MKNTGAHLDWFTLLSFEDAIVLLQLVTDVCETDGLTARLRIPDELHVRYEWGQKEVKNVCCPYITVPELCVCTI